MSYKLHLQIAGLCGIVRKNDYFEIWMVDARDPLQLRLPSSLRSQIDAHLPRLFVHGESTFSNGPLNLTSPAYACDDGRVWKAVDLAEWDGTLAIGNSSQEPMNLNALQLTRLRDLTGGRGGSAYAQYTSSILSVRLGLEAVVAVRTWPDPVEFAHCKGGYPLTHSVEIRVHNCTEELSLLVNRRGQQPAGILRLAGDDGGNLLVFIRNEVKASHAGAACPGDREFAAHYHVLTDPGSLDPYYPYPTGFFEVAAADDAQCSPVEYPFP